MHRGIYLSLRILQLFSLGASLSPLYDPGVDQQVILEPAASPHDSSFESWLDSQVEISTVRLLDNVAPGGKNVPDIRNGTIIASPSKAHPDYFYQWTRDSALTASTLVDLYIRAPNASFAHRLEDILKSYATLQGQLQHTKTRSGTFRELSGLGEPKFHVSGKPFSGSWGRPQHDGPALRALALIKFVRAYNETHADAWTDPKQRAWLDELYKAVLPVESVIKADLEYVSRYVAESGFDLWEERDGIHFFTTAVQYRAMEDGSDFARAFKDSGAAAHYERRQDALAHSMKRFWNSDRGHLVETTDATSRSGLDCGLLLGSIQSHPPGSESTSHPYAPYSDELLITLLRLINDQKDRYPINSQPIFPEGTHIVHADHELAGVGIGRYPEDRYDGDGTSQGNPWFICTAAVAEVFYRTSRQLQTTKELHVGMRAHPFWEALLAPMSSAMILEVGGRYSDLDPIFTDAVAQLNAVGDAFLRVIRAHADRDGALSEQFDRETGFERGARDLTWSYSAFLQAAWAREMVV